MMEQKMIKIPFDLELAKKIQAGELPGKIVTRDGSDVRIVCWNRKHDIFPILALVHFEKCTNEYCASYKVNGCNLANESKYKNDLLLQVPEWTQFKDGDILATKKGSSFILNANGEYRTSSYVSLLSGRLSFGGSVLGDHIEVMTCATEEQKQQLIDALKQSTDPRAKEYLKRFFGIEEKKECGFEFLQPVLVRFRPSCRWYYGYFTHMFGELHCISGGNGYKFCIPYNEKTKHLLGTTDDWEE